MPAESVTEFPVNALNTPGVGVDWVNPSNVINDNGVYATAVLNAGQTTDYLAIGWNFNIPENATIDGFFLEIEAKESGAGIVDFECFLASNGVEGDNKAAGTGLSASDTVIEYGGSSDLWGATLTPEDINDAFGVLYKVQNGGGAASTASIDFARMTIYYTTNGQANYMMACQ